MGLYGLENPRLHDPGFFLALCENPTVETSDEIGVDSHKIPGQFHVIVDIVGWHFLYLSSFHKYIL